MRCDARRASILATLFLATSSAPCHADHLVELEQIRSGYRGEERIASERRVVKAWLGDQQARLDRGRVSFVLRQHEGKLLLLDHEKRTYMSFQLPLRMEDYLGKEAAKTAAHTAEHLAPRIDIRKLDEFGTIDRWTARRYLLEVTLSDGQVLYSGDFWLSQDTPAVLSRYEDLMRTIESFSLLAQGWRHQILDLEGIVVRRSKTENRRGADVSTTETLKAVRQVEEDAERYRPPDGYELTEVDPRIFMHLSPGRHLPHGGH